MEVHAHTHTERKKWTHYLWEFLMLFLAVFCGFLAENQREHIVEQKREKQYIKSFCEDLAADETDLQTIIDRLSKILNGRDYAKIIDTTNQVINPSEILYLRSTDDDIINYCLMKIDELRGLNSGLKMRIQRLKERAARVKKFISKEYHLK